MAEDWLADVRHYAPDADEGVVQKIINYLGIALRNRDSSLVSFSDASEVGLVREHFLRKKLGLTDSDERLDEGIDAVRRLMGGDRTKNRVTVYYLLTDWFGKLDLFGGRESTPGAFTFGRPGLSAAAPAAAAATAGAAAAGATLHAVAPDPVAERVVTADVPPARPAYVADLDDDDGGGGIPGWLKALLLVAALVALFLLFRSCMATPEPVATTTGSVVSDSNVVAPPTLPDTAAIPTGAGVVASDVAGKPGLNVYFETGKSQVSNDLAAQAAKLKAYLDANPGSKLAVSGYNDPTGNAALNAELSKNRAKGVAAALAAAGIPQGSIELVKPAETTKTTVTPEEARRVEVRVE